MAKIVMPSIWVEFHYKKHTHLIHKLTVQFVDSLLEMDMKDEAITYLDKTHTFGPTVARAFVEKYHEDHMY